MKRVIILGSTGSIGENALRVIKSMRNDFRVIGLSASLNFRRLLEQAEEFNVKDVVVADERAAAACRKAAKRGIRIGCGEEGLVALASEKDADVILCSIVGMAALMPVAAAINTGKNIALATKEILVAAGSVLMPMAEKKNVNFLPVDSEHSAIFQCLCGAALNGNAMSVRSYSHVLKKIILTASGGPFIKKEKINWDKVTVKEALRHPRWKMGRKITIDSATMMNKGLEIMEAMWLFGVPFEKVNLLIHPESIVHSMIEFADGSILAQMSVPDMRIAIQYALTWPEHKTSNVARLNLAEIGNLHFSAVDVNRFPCLRLALEAAKTGGTMPAVLNEANDVAVDMFLQGRIRFSDIWNIVEMAMQKHVLRRNPSLDDILEAAKWSRKMALTTLQKIEIRK